jgi:hypothetical protein
MSYNSPFTANVIQPTDVSFRAITLSANTTLSWPINGNATDNYAARIMNVTATTAGLSLSMPPANQASVGQDALIRNTGGNDFTVKDYDGNTIILVEAGKAEYIYITTNANTAGTWGVIHFGVGTSNADAATLAGAGLLASGATLNQSHEASTLVDGYTFIGVDRALVKTWYGGVGSATLSSVGTLANNWFTIIKNNGSGTLTINTTGSDTIDGAASKTYQPNEASFIVCTGTEFITVGYGVSNIFVFNALVKSITGGTVNLSTSEAANVIQEFVGTLSSNATIVYPPTVGFYVVSNQTSAGSFTMTLTTGIVGSTTVVLPANQQATLICDGTNFYNANTTQAGASSYQLVNGSAGSPALSFASEASTGVYRPGAGSWSVSVLGNNIFNVTASGISVSGTGTFSGGVSGGTFT